jgi:predicted esterase
MQEHRLPVPRTARYFTLGEPGREVTDAWFVCHGYGQLASQFLKACGALEGPRRLLVAPEGLSRFYTDHQTGSVGASWMTREDREREIADYVRYLDAVAAAVLPRVSSSVRRSVLGFSQGAATATRWAALGRVRADRLVLWGGGVPPDLDLQAHRVRLGSAELVLVVGSRDRYLRRERVDDEHRRLTEAGLACRVITFEGGHRLDDATLRALAG